MGGSGPAQSRMLLILLHRLKFSIRDDVLILAFLLLFLNAAPRRSFAAHPGPPADAPSGVSGERGRRSSGGGHFAPANLPHDSFIYNVRRQDEEPRVRQSDNVRWRRISIAGELLARREKRSAADSASTTESAAPVAWKNSTKSLNFSGGNLTETIELRRLNESIAAGDAFSDILELNFAHNKIEWFAGSALNAFANITSLNLADNHIVKFPPLSPTATSPPARLGRLLQLNLSENAAAAFDGGQSRKLQQADLSCNAFAEPKQLNLSQLSDLEFIDLSCNRLSALDAATFRNSTTLRTLNLAGNRLRRIRKNDFYNLLRIEFLILSNNDISTVESDAFVYLPNLQFLDLSHNRLDAASVRSLQAIPDLTSLSVAHNRRLGDALQGFVTSWSLKELDASGTGLCHIPAALAQSVHTLNLSSNHFQVSRASLPAEETYLKADREQRVSE